MSQPVSITGFSTALFSTWYFVEQFGVLFDCGDGATATLLQKSRRVQHVFVSHADRDHLTGLFQFNQLNGRQGLTIHFPRDSGSFAAIAEFASKFDPHISGTRWNPLASGDCVQLRDNLRVQAIENSHVSTDGTKVKSLSYVVQTIRKKLKPEYSGMAGEEIARYRVQRGADAIVDEICDLELIYSGDTPVETDGRYTGARILIHESTFLTRSDLGPATEGRNQHSSLDAVMEMVANNKIGNLVLGHFSSRYSDTEIDEAVDREKSRCGIDIPVQVIYPGRTAQLLI